MTNKTMGDMIVELRKGKNLTQAQLAEMMSVTDKTVSKWERNLSCPDVGSIAHLAEILGVSADELLKAKMQPQTKKYPSWEIINLALRAVGLGMGIAVVVLSALGNLEVNTAISLLGIGLACIAISVLDSENKKQ